MNFKSLALGSVLALGSIFGGVQLAEAGTVVANNGQGGTIVRTSNGTYQVSGAWNNNGVYQSFGEACYAVSHTFSGC